MKKTITYDQLLVVLKHAMILNDERMPKSIYDSFNQIEMYFGECGKMAMMIHLGDVIGDTFCLRGAMQDIEANPYVFDNLDQLVKLLEKHGVEVTGAPK
jgi:hypothetical protein